MKQIDKIARDIKATFAGTYNNYYKSCNIYLDAQKNELYVQNLNTGGCYLTDMILLVGYSAYYGNWVDTYGPASKWTITKKQIAKDIKSSCEENDIEIPKWLQEEIDCYLNK